MNESVEIRCVGYCIMHCHYNIHMNGVGNNVIANNFVRLENQTKEPNSTKCGV